MNSPVIQIFYIIAGVIFALIIDAASKYVVPNINKKPMNGVHIIYCILTPLVIWQFIFQFTVTLEEDTIINFLNGIILLFVFFLMAIISKIVYPSSVKDYSIEDEDYNKHIKENRHLFFILLAIYLFVLTWAYKSLFGKLEFDDYVRVGMGVIIILFGAMFYIIRKKNIDFTFPIIEQNEEKQQNEDEEQNKRKMLKIIYPTNLPSFSSTYDHIKKHTSSYKIISGIFRRILLLDTIKISVLQRPIEGKIEKDKASILDWLILLILIGCFIYFVDISIDTKVNEK